MASSRPDDAETTTPAAPAAMASGVGPITLGIPSKYTGASAALAASAPAIEPPPTEWLAGTWTVTHSTLKMWRSARNVRITYTPLPAGGDGRERIDDLVEYEPHDDKGSGKLSSVTGVDTRNSRDGGWDWRGKGMLFFVSSHWEVLGWGETKGADGTTQRWAVTWFAPTMFTKEGLDIYSDSKEGLSDEVYQAINKALLNLSAKPIADMTREFMKPVHIQLPWAAHKN